MFSLRFVETQLFLCSVIGGRFELKVLKQFEAVILSVPTLQHNTNSIHSLYACQHPSKTIDKLRAGDLSQDSLDGFEE